MENVSRRTLLALGAVAAGEVLLHGAARAAAPQHRAVVWSEGTAPKKVYPHDINTAIADGLKPLKNWEIVKATITDPEQGCSEESLAKTDVLLWWGHKLHGKVTDETVNRIVRHVKDDGMGFIALHSSHFSKALKKLLGTNCGWKGGYSDDHSKLEIIVQDKKHPIAHGVQDFKLANTERYGEPYEVPPPEAVVLDGIYTLPNGTTEHSRHGLVWTVGKGKVFYFQAGHEDYPHYFDPNVRKILCNAVAWMAKKA